MGSGGVRASCQSTLCILAGIILGLALFCLLCGGIVYGVSITVSGASGKSPANRTTTTTSTASNSTGHSEAELDVWFVIAVKGASLMENAYLLFYAASALGIVSATLLVLSHVAAYKSRPTLIPPAISEPYAPAVAMVLPAEDAERGARSEVPLAVSSAGSPPSPISPPAPPASPFPQPAASPIP